MNKKILAAAAALLCAVIVCANVILAREPVDVSRNTSLNAYVTCDEEVLPGVTVNIYRIGEMKANSSFRLLSPYSKYPVTLENKTDEDWAGLALALKSYIEKDSIAPTATVVSDKNGSFSYEGKTGLYLILGERTRIGRMKYDFTPVIISLPTLDENDNWKYDVKINMNKVTSTELPNVTPTDKTVSRKVLKVWDDESDPSKRPAEITVHLLRNGKVYDTVKITKDDNWRYEWSELRYYDDAGDEIEWLVAEEPVDGYAVRLRIAGITFVVTNTTETTPPGPGPDESDTDTDTEPETTEPGTETKPDETTDEPPYTMPHTETENETGHDPGDDPTTGTRDLTEEPSSDPKKSEPATTKGPTPYPETKPHGDNPNEDLPQTGMLLWPVPVLFVVGVVLILTGVICRKVKKDEE